VAHAHAGKNGTENNGTIGTFSILAL